MGDNIFASPCKCTLIILVIIGVFYDSLAGFFGWGLPLVIFSIIVTAIANLRLDKKLNKRK